MLAFDSVILLDSNNKNDLSDAGTAFDAEMQPGSHHQLPLLCFGTLPLVPYSGCRSGYLGVLKDPVARFNSQGLVRRADRAVIDVGRNRSW